MNHHRQHSIVHVQMVIMALNVNLIIESVNLILVWTMVNILSSSFSFRKSTTRYLFIGICNELSSTTFNCTCAPGWEGENCEKMINYCYDGLCENNGVCCSSLLNYSCECLRGSYSGRHCEISSMQTLSSTESKNLWL